MNSAGEAMARKEIPEGWQPQLELACREVFEIMLGCKLEVRNEPGTAAPEFTAMVGLAGQLCGVLSLRCTAEAAMLMASRMLGVDTKQADQHMPRSCAEAGILQQVVPLTQIPDKIFQATRHPRHA